MRIAVVIAAWSLSVLAVHADDASAWLKDRRARVAAYQAAHPHPDAEIAAIKARTAALVAAGPPVATLQARLDAPPLTWRTSDQPIALWDGADDPEMIVIPAGENVLGSTPATLDHQPYEIPRHRIRIAYAFAVGKYPVTVGEFARFVADTGYDAGDECYTSEPAKQPMKGRNWRNPGFEQTDDFPVQCLNWSDAKAYVAWLSHRTGHAYRLLSEAEYDYANRAGTTTTYFWGDDPNAACAYANGADLDTKAHYPQMLATACHDGFAFASPVGRFKPNAFGLYDTVGETWSWLEDCWSESYVGAPTDGSANRTGDCAQPALRGGSWSARPQMLRAAQRLRYAGDLRIDDHGFRVARGF
jgi:formylglycine-generating enzyme required for sulfatase activity